MKTILIVWEMVMSKKQKYEKYIDRETREVVAVFKMASGAFYKIRTKGGVVIKHSTSFNKQYRIQKYGR